MSDSTGTTIIHSGISLGSVIAVAISWSLHKSIVWAAIHGGFGWFYVFFYAFTRESS
jgi:hypothetical protein